MQPLSATELLKRMFDVELWLVHGAPGREDQVLPQRLRVGAEGSAFAFAPVRISTPSGAFVVHVSGRFRMMDEGGQPRLEFVTTRSLTAPGPPRDAQGIEKPITQGTSSRTATPMPGPGEVLSFELPPLRLSGGRVSPPDGFAVRVRVTPL